MGSRSVAGLFFAHYTGMLRDLTSLNRDSLSNFNFKDIASRFSLNNLSTKGKLTIFVIALIAFLPKIAKRESLPTLKTTGTFTAGAATGIVATYFFMRSQPL